MLSGEKARFLVLVTDRTEIAPNNLKVCVVTTVVSGHLEHAQMEVCNWAERAACDQNYRLLGGISKDPIETVRGKGVAWWVGEVGRGRW